MPHSLSFSFSIKPAPLLMFLAVIVCTRTSGQSHHHLSDHKNQKASTMFTIGQIVHAHASVKSGADFPKYFQELKGLGVLAFDTYVSDSHSEYYGAGSYHILSGPKYPVMTIAPNATLMALDYIIKVHQQGETDYTTFCQQVANVGVEKWRVDVEAMTCTYYDRSGNAMLIEPIPNVAE